MIVFILQENNFMIGEKIYVGLGNIEYNRMYTLTSFHLKL